MSIIRTPEGHYVVDTDSHLSVWVREQRRLNIAEEQIAFYAHHIPEGGVVVDAGACIGDHTATLARLVGPTGIVYAMEPNPLAYEALRLNFSGQSHVMTLNCGLSDCEQEVRFKQETNVGACHVADDGDATARLRTVDSMQLPRLDFAHFDCEGFEARVLSGAIETIKRCRPVIVLEIGHAILAKNGSSEAYLRAYLDTLGYDVKEIEPHHGPHLPQRDVIALPRK